MPQVDSTTNTQLSRLRTHFKYWSKQVAKIRNKKGQLVDFNLNEVQRRIEVAEYHELKKKGRARIYVLKGRQGGVSTHQQLKSLHLVWGTPGTQALTLAHSGDDTDKLFRITRRAVKEIDARLLPKKGAAEAKEVQFPQMDSYFWTGTAGSRRVGRGLTLTRFHGSEFAFWENPKQVLSSVTPALNAPGTTMVLETTPDEYGSEAHLFWQKAVSGENSYLPLFFPWWECDKANYRAPLFEQGELGELSEEEFELVEQYGLTLEEIKWRRMMIHEMGESDFLREYPEDPDTCWISAGEKFYDIKVLQSLTRRAPEPRETKDNGRIRIFDDPHYEHPEGGLVYEGVIIGGDTAEGGAQSDLDRSAATARAFPSWRLIADFISKSVEPREFAFILNKLGREYSLEDVPALLIIEKNQHGITVLRHLRDDHKYPRKCIYHRTPLSKNFDVKTDFIGWATTGESKPLMLDAGTDLLKAASDGMVDIPTKEALRDAWSVSPDGELTGRDVLVTEMLAWLARSYYARRKIQVLDPVFFSSTPTK